MANNKQHWGYRLAIFRDLGYVHMGNKKVGVSAGKHHHAVSIALIQKFDERYEISDERGSDHIYRRAVYFSEEHCAFGAGLERLKFWHCPAPNSSR